MSEHYLAGLRLEGRRVAVIGGGSVAQRRLPALLAAGAQVLLVSPHVTATIEGLLAGGGVEWAPRRYRDADLAGVWFVLAATDDPRVNAEVAAAADRDRIFCVRADDATGGSAATPAVVADGSVQVGVLGGLDPRRAAAVRDGVAEALREGRLDVLPRRTGRAGVAVVGGGPGDPDLITVRGRRLLSHADVVVADRLAPQPLLAQLRPGTEVVDAAKLPRGRAMAQQAINDLLVGRALSGQFVVRLKGGDPFVFGRGAEEVQACVAAGVTVTVVPGVTSALAVPALAGIPLTHRGVAHEAVVVSGHLSPQDPASLVDWPALARLRGTLVVLMGVERLAQITDVLLAHGRAPEAPAAVVQDGSLPGERVVVAPLQDLAEHVARAGIRPPAVIVVGGVVGLRDRLGHG